MQAAPPPRYVDIREGDPGPAVAVGRGSAQLGAFATQVAAEQLVRAVRAASDPPPPLRVRPIHLRGRLWFRVIAGPLDSDAVAKLCARQVQRRQPCWARPAPP